MKEKTLFILSSILILLCGACTKEYYLEKVWETNAIFSKPESVVYDEVRDQVYVSNYNKYPAAIDSADDFISIVDLEGRIVELKWITGLKAPTGITIHADHLFIAERDGISKYSIRAKELVDKYMIEAGFLNDLSIDEEGRIYFTDSSPRDPDACIVCGIDNENLDTIANEMITGANGIFHHKGSLLVGSSGDMCLKEIDLESGELNKMAQLDTGIIDGIKHYERDMFLVSHWEGKLFLVSSKGMIRELLDIEKDNINIADFEYIKGLNLVIIPSFNDNRVIAYRITAGYKQPH